MKPSVRISEIYNQLEGGWWISGEPKDPTKWMQSIEMFLDEEHEKQATIQLTQGREK